MGLSSRAQARARHRAGASVAEFKRGARQTVAAGALNGRAHPDVGRVWPTTQRGLSADRLYGSHHSVRAFAMSGLSILWGIHGSILSRRSDSGGVLRPAFLNTAATASLLPSLTRVFNAALGVLRAVLDGLPGLRVRAGHVRHLDDSCGEPSVSATVGRVQSVPRRMGQGLQGRGPGHASNQSGACEAK